ncbi:MAG TPA: ABC transporter permease [Pyrodictium sp.]|nr:ABC transporter permease [Pyrodictium sp.]
MQRSIRIPVRVEPLVNVTFRRKIVVFTTTYLLAILGFLLFLYLKGYDGISILSHILFYTFTVGEGIRSLLSTWGIVSIIALGALISFKVRVWNIGLEGQYIAGAIGATYAALFMPCISPLNLTLQLLLGFILGMLWAFVPALLYVLISVNEVLSTIMLNYVAVHLLEYLLYGPWSGTYGFPQTRLFPARFGQVGGLPSPLVAAIILFFIAYVVMYRLRIGLVYRFVGENRNAASLQGYNVKLVLLLCFLISGGLAGVAGVFEASYELGYLSPGIVRGYGFAGIAAAVLGRLEPLTTLFASLFIAFFLVGAYSVHLPALGFLAEGLLLIAHLSAEALTRYKIVIMRGGVY